MRENRLFRLTWRELETWRMRAPVLDPTEAAGTGNRKDGED